MAQYTIGEVEEITGVKPHILRYWEEVIPSIAPQKNIGGRRMYSLRDVQLIMRLRYLIQEKKFTIEGARNCLLEDAAIISNVQDNNYGNLAEALTLINELRSDLISLFTDSRKNNNANE